MKKTTFIGAVALALSACSEPVKENSNVIQVDIENAQPMNLSDFVESIQLVPLETTDESLYTWQMRTSAFGLISKRDLKEDDNQVLVIYTLK